MHYSTMEKDELRRLLAEEAKNYERIKKEGLSADIARGKPCPEQLDAVMGIFDEFSKDTKFDFDPRNYGDIYGVPAMRKIFADILNVSENNVISTGGGSLNLMYDTVQRALQFGIMGSASWNKYEKIRFICPSPGYDRHFAICEHFGIEMIAVPMQDDGPDMDIVESIAASDESVKGIWCIPKFSNPTGAVYSDEVVTRLAKMKTAAGDFRIFWDNAYAVHLLTDEDVPLKNILSACKDAGNEDRVYMFTSTAKITFPGGSCSCVATSANNIKDILSHYQYQTICSNKVYQSVTAAYIKNMDNLKEIMRRHAEIIKPKFDVLLEALDNAIGDLGFAEFTGPKGGYFISLNVLPGTAKRLFELAKGAGLTLTPPGATYPYGIDDADSNLRIAPTFLSAGELENAAKILACCLRLSAFEKLAA